jgi:hypothetical protein
MFHLENYFYQKMLYFRKADFLSDIQSLMSTGNPFQSAKVTYPPASRKLPTVQYWYVFSAVVKAIDPQLCSYVVLGMNSNLLKLQRLCFCWTRERWIYLNLAFFRTRLRLYVLLRWKAICTWILTEVSQDFLHYSIKWRWWQCTSRGKILITITAQRWFLASFF